MDSNFMRCRGRHRPETACRRVVGSSPFVAGGDSSGRAPKHRLLGDVDDLRREFLAEQK